MLRWRGKAPVLNNPVSRQWALLPTTDALIPRGNRSLFRGRELNVEAVSRCAFPELVRVLRMRASSCGETSGSWRDVHRCRAKKHMRPKG